ncbi:PREDICTED: FERM domain-containing protein 4A [Wasmannia auropunctata]|uniref:FERM domain-containing protein 4A n=1 Tax=Wasmannia auropunctata TaxID=64793 RepID=UPI0005EFD065|nr:PREDICTED: FERM domain-containing protein 4A [Wasmannia auropunctata]XP_011690346.1 PREDICTED: FERM domain-containing protein 4A [Wasmannia auropunctata]XP_011690347.1 PREDICTED: FERM domain-containing protein 4A [Wasmannia auropunctata]
MVMAGNENAPGDLADNPLSARLQWLRQRREALQEKLAQKNNELKNLCVEEAEITGVLPPEIPLEPGESPPAFRRKVGTSFVQPQKTTKLKTPDAEESELELERQIHLGIVEAALGIINDSTESKTTRRKQRLAYQQSQRRLQELETQLNFIRQSRGKTQRPTQLSVNTGNYNTQPHSHVNVKHRTKKPRPPLDSTGNEITTPKSIGRGILHEPGVSLSPLAPEDKSSTYHAGHGYEEQLTVPSVCSHHHHSGSYPGVSPVEQPSIKIVEHDHNDNHNIYILPEQYRARTYSHGSGGSRGHYPDTERMYRPYVPNTYTEDERQMRYRQFQHLQKQQQQLQDQMQQAHRHQYLNSFEFHKQVMVDNVDFIRRSSYDRDFRSSYLPIDYQAYYKNSAQCQQILQRRDRDSSLQSCVKNTSRHSGGGGGGSTMSIEAQLPSGYWVRHNDDIHWISTDEPDRFGSLDRRRRNAQHSSASDANLDAHSRYRTVAVACPSKSSSNSNVTASSYQHHSVHLLPLSEQQTLPTSNKMLLRTQSLGSVETWQSSCHSHDAHDGKDASAGQEYANNNRKGRQKEWYETSLDAGASAGLDQSHHNLATARKNVHYHSSPPPARIKAAANENARDSQTTAVGPPPPMSPPVNRHKRDKPEERQHAVQQSHPHYDQPATTRSKVLEIPAESKPSLDVCDNVAIRPLGSPQNCTVVQPGKYQPYREVTKPFEMSDFYKYSTKFRKRNEAAAQSSQVGNGDSPLQENRPAETATADLSRDSNSYNFGPNDNITASPVQRRLYQPVQRMTCQPYISSLR